MGDVFISLPWPPTKLSANGSQGDYRGKAKAARAYKATCAKLCWAQRVRKMSVDSVRVDVTFSPPALRAYDLDNALKRCKTGLDAVAEAIGVDDAKWQSMTLKRGAKVSGGAVLVHIKPASASTVEIPHKGQIG